MHGGGVGGGGGGGAGCLLMPSIRNQKSAL